MIRRTGLKRKSKTEFAKAVNRLDIAFSFLIRSHYLPLHECMDNCGIIIKDIKEADCGHFRRRECMGTRFNPRNAVLQARKCNRFDGGRPYEMSLMIDKLWGKGTAQSLEKESRKMKNWEIKELEQLCSAAKIGWLPYVQLYDELTA